MPIKSLPEGKSKVESYNPSLLVLFGKPKSGKSSLMASLEDNLILDCEDGYRSLEVLKVQVRTARDFFDVRNLLIAKTKELGKKPYRFITIDNATKLEEYTLPYAAQKYRNTSMGQSWGFKTDANGMPVLDPSTKKPMIDPNADVRKLPNGAGL